jgi:uncharacterized protein (DUF1800 family)
MVYDESIAAFRFGYGFRPGEAAARPGAMLAGVKRAAGDAAGRATTLPEREAAFTRLFQAQRRRQTPGGPAKVQAALAAIRQGFAADRASRVAQAVLSPNGFSERLVWFWTDHFTVSARGGRLMSIGPAFEADVIRPRLAGDFATLLRAAVKHPAMLEFLGQAASIGPGSQVGLARGLGLNENLAREVLELHPLGVGADYGQADVRQFAELLTGLGVDRKAGAMVFRPERAEPGAETVLGTPYGGAPVAEEADIDAALDALAAHPATARHVATKLAVHFVSDDPDPDLVAHLAETFRRFDGDLMAVYAALLEHPASWRGLGPKVRQPFEFVVASLRAAGVRDQAGLAGFAADPETNPVAALARMNQPIWSPSGPDGWPEAADAWISPPGLTGRIDWASRLGVALGPAVDPRAFVETALGPLARAETRFAARVAAERWEGIALVLASPEFNRR